MTHQIRHVTSKPGGRRRLVYVTLFVLAAFCAGAWGVTRAGIGGPTTASTATGATQAAPQRPPAQTADVVRVALTRFGFNPLKVTRPRGRFLLAVDDRSGLEAANISLVRVAGGKMHDVRVSRKNPRWFSLIDLPPGDYKLVEASRPDWACEIRITAKED